MSENVVRNAAKNIKYVLLSQILVFVLGIFKSLVLPKYLGVEGFGYWQIYLLYLSYVGMFALGFNDGIYLRYGSYQYNELPFKKIRSSIRIYTYMLIIFTVSMCILSLYIIDGSKIFPIFMAFLNIFIIGIYGVFIFIYQITNQMKKYSFFSLIDKIIVMMSLIFIMIINERNYKFIIVVDCISKAITVALMIYSCKELWFGDIDRYSESIKEFILNIKVGVNLMIANLMGMFVIGIGRFIVEQFGSIKQYSYYSFGISITNLVLIFIASVSTVLYPTLKRLSENNYSIYFEEINRVLSLFNITALLVYFPSYLFILYIMPDYSPMLIYLNLLFGVVFLQGKMQLLNNSFYNALREEKAMFKANMSCVIIFTILVSAIFPFVKLIWIIAACTFITMIFRCYLSEIFLRKKMECINMNIMLKEIIVLLIFILSTTLLNLKLSFIIFIIVYARIMFNNRKLIKSLLLKILNKRMV